MFYVCVSVAQVLYQRPDSLRVLCCILAFRVFALFWIETTNVLHGVCWSHSSSFRVTAHNAPITNGLASASAPLVPLVPGPFLLSRPPSS